MVSFTPVSLMMWWRVVSSRAFSLTGCTDRGSANPCDTNTPRNLSDTFRKFERNVVADFPECARACLKTLHKTTNRLSDVLFPYRDCPLIRYSVSLRSQKLSMSLEPVHWTGSRLIGWQNSVKKTVKISHRIPIWLQILSIFASLWSTEGFEICSRSDGVF
jgi:hypothetical protein